MNPALPSPSASIATIERQRALLDAKLTVPARWRGPLRREFRRTPCPADRTRVAHAFDRLGWDALDGRELDVGLLLEVHRIAIGGGRFRSGPIRVGKAETGFVRCPPARLVPRAVEQALDWAITADEAPPLAAARLHLNLALAHPFEDGNGRTARLIASYLLMRAGFRSTLFTAVEQHFFCAPSEYRAGFRALADDLEGNSQRWLTAALAAMSSASAYAYWVRTGGNDRSAAGSALEPLIRMQVRRLHDEEEAESQVRSFRSGVA